jgi:small-conductance mechanosensitive channel
MKSRVKQTITAILLLAIFVFLLIVITFVLVNLFMAEKPMSLTFAIFLSVSFIIIISLSTSGINDMITEINELIRQEEKELEEKEEE